MDEIEKKLTPYDQLDPDYKAEMFEAAPFLELFGVNVTDLKTLMRAYPQMLLHDVAEEDVLEDLEDR